MGKPLTPPQNQTDTRMPKIKALFGECQDGLLAKKDFAGITKAIDLPLYWKCPLFEACSSTEFCSLPQFLQVNLH